MWMVRMQEVDILYSRCATFNVHNIKLTQYVFLPILVSNFFFRVREVLSVYCVLVQWPWMKKNVLERNDLWNSKTALHLLFDGFSPHQWLNSDVLKTNHALFVCFWYFSSCIVIVYKFRSQTVTQNRWSIVETKKKMQIFHENKNQNVYEKPTIDKRLMWFVAIKAYVLL